MATLKHMATHGDRYIKDAIKALKAAIKAGDKVEDIDGIYDDCNWRVTAAGIENCLDVLTSKPAKALAAEIWGPANNPGSPSQPKATKSKPKPKAKARRTAR